MIMDACTYRNGSVDLVNGARLWETYDCVN